MGASNRSRRGSPAGSKSGKPLTPVIAYPHYVRVGTHKCFPQCEEISLSGYTYPTDLDGNEDSSADKVVIPIDRRQYSPDGSSTPIGGLPLFVRKHDRTLRAVGGPEWTVGKIAFCAKSQRGGNIVGHTDQFVLRSVLAGGIGIESRARGFKRTSMGVVKGKAELLE